VAPCKGLKFETVVVDAAAAGVSRAAFGLCHNRFWETRTFLRRKSRSASPKPGCRLASLGVDDSKGQWRGGETLSDTPA
jgi:hypothetical protein